VIEEVAIVREVHCGHAVVETQVKTTCGQCAAKNNCGTSSIAKAFSNKSTFFSVETNAALKTGDVIKVGIPENDLVSAAFYVYIAPILSLFSGVALIAFLLPSLSEWFQLLFGVLCAGLTLKWLQKRYGDTNAGDQFTPVFLKKISNGDTFSINHLN